MHPRIFPIWKAYIEANRYTTGQGTWDTYTYVPKMEMNLAKAPPERLAGFGLARHFAFCARESPLSPCMEWSRKPQVISGGFEEDSFRTRKFLTDLA